MTFREETKVFIDNILKDVSPEEAVINAVKNFKFNENGNLYLVAVGKAAWVMASSAYKVLGDKIKKGIVLTKYNHSKTKLPKIKIIEAGHPIPDENSYMGTKEVLKLVANLKNEDTVIFLLSGGGSSLFELPLLPEKEIEKLNKDLLESGADIIEINTLRKRFSKVKGGKFALACMPAKVYSVILSDIIGDPLDMIASGPAYADSKTKEDAKAIVKKYKLDLSDLGKELLEIETPKKLDNVETVITGSVKVLCESAKKMAICYGYTPIILTDCLCTQAKEAGRFLGNIAKTYKDSTKNLAFICGGETVVNIIGKGKGGRNQELALAFAKEIEGIDNIALFSLGSDGTDGPTDAAGGFVDGNTAKIIREKGETIEEILNNNDAYNGLKLSDGLIITGPTGTNVNDVTVLLIKAKKVCK